MSVRSVGQVGCHKLKFVISYSDEVRNFYGKGTNRNHPQNTALLPFSDSLPFVPSFYYPPLGPKVPLQGKDHGVYLQGRPLCPFQLDWAMASELFLEIEVETQQPVDLCPKLLKSRVLLESGALCRRNSKIL